MWKSSRILDFQFDFLRWNNIQENVKQNKDKEVLDILMNECYKLFE